MAEPEAQEPQDSRQPTREGIKEVNEVRAMAEKVAEVVDAANFTQLEVLCYSVLFASGMAIGIGDEEFLTAMRVAGRRLFNLHYNLKLEGL